LASIGTAYLDIEGNYGPLTKGAKKGVGTATKVAGAAIAAGLGVALKGAIDEAREAAKATAQTNAVIKSTGGVAKVTAKELGSLSNALSNKAGIDDEAIQSAGNLLLTFKDVRDEVGKNNDIFSQALPLITDMSVAMGQDLKSSTVQVGKALNDPIKGMTALSRVGVTFSQGQKDLIKTLVESGDKMGAQKIILKELRSEFEGSAAAQADPFDKFKVAIDNLKESIGVSLLPVLAEGADALSGFIDDMQTGEGFGGGLVRGVESAFGEIKGIINDGVAGFEGSSSEGFIGQLADGIGAAIGGIDWPAVMQFGEGMKTAVSDGISDAMAGIDTKAVANTLLEVTLDVLTLAMDPLWIADHIAEIIGIALAFSKIGILKKIPLIGPVLAKIGDFIWDVGKVIVKKVFGKLATVAIDALKGGLGKLPVEIGVVLISGLNKLKSLGGKFAASGETLGEKVGAGIVTGVKWTASKLWSAGKWLMGKLWDGIKAAFQALVNIGKDAGGKIRAGIASLWSKFYKLGGFLLGKLKDGLIKAPLNGLAALGKRIGNAIQGGIGKLKAKVGIGGGLPVLNKLGNDKGNFGKVSSLAASFGTGTGGPGQGYRPGDPGWHGKNRARDYSGGNMMGFAKAVAAKFGGGLLELIHTPLGFGIKNGRKVGLGFWGPEINADHYDHVHVAMQTGGKRGGRGEGGKSPKVIWDEGKMTEWWISQEGDKDKNTRWGVEALESVSGARVALFKGGGKKAKLKKKATRAVEKFNTKVDREDALDAAYEQEKYNVNLQKRLKQIDKLLKNKYLSGADRTALLNARGQVTDAIKAANEVDPVDPAEDPAVALAAAIAENTAAQTALADEQRQNRAFADRVHTANKSVTDTTLNAILDKSLAGTLSQMLLTLSPRMAT
jgi:hypothetical protein